LSVPAHSTDYTLLVGLLVLLVIGGLFVAARRRGETTRAVSV
jgi:LPXTG-motif cell wall-anchored protein